MSVIEMMDDLSESCDITFKDTGRIGRDGALLHVADPSESFWARWKVDKLELRDSGISVSSSTGSWKVCAWVPAGETYGEEKKQITKVMQQIKINKKITKLLLDEQQCDHTSALVAALQQYQAVLDGSEMGTGKTYTAAAASAVLKSRPVVICPATMVPVWRLVLSLFDVIPFDVTSYEMARKGTSYAVHKVEKDENDKKKHSYEWNLPDDVFVIFDEVHRCRDRKAMQTNLLIFAVSRKIPLLMLSATAAETPFHLYAIGYALKLFKQQSDYWKWLRGLGAVPGPFGAFYIAKGKLEAVLKKLHQAIFDTGRGVRMLLKNMAFDNIIAAECFASSHTKEIEHIYDDMAELEDRQDDDDEEHHLVKMLRLKQRIELLKADMVAELAQDAIAEGRSVVIFVNYTETLERLASVLKTKSVIRGGQNTKVRMQIINDFQADKTRVLIANYQAGGVGISLHDTHGNFARLSLCMPTDRAVDLKQAFGRIHRAGQKTPSLQKIPFVKGVTTEERVCRNVSNKITNMAILNDGDLAVRFEIVKSSRKSVKVKSKRKGK